jgi:hypothetical protein
MDRGNDLARGIGDRGGHRVDPERELLPDPRVAVAPDAPGAKPIGKVVIGTVKGDIHDIGKNLVAMMLASSSEIATTRAHARQGCENTNEYDADLAQR